MSRFSTLRKYLGLPEAISIYTKIKTGNYKSWKLSKLRHPFSLRNNPYDYATFEEVILREDYNINIGFTPKTIIDGGANIGLTAAYFATKFPSAQIVTVEPDSNNFDLLVKNTQQYKNIKPVNAGIWNRKVNLEVKDGGQGNNAFTVLENPAGTIPALSIKDLIDQQGWPNADIIKLDIEGSEKEVFEKNFEQWLPSTKILIVELHDRMKKGCSEAVFNAIKQYDFSSEEKGENIVFRNKALIQ